MCLRNMSFPDDDSESPTTHDDQIDDIHIPVEPTVHTEQEAEPIYQ